MELEQSKTHEKMLISDPKIMEARILVAQHPSMARDFDKIKSEIKRSLSNETLFEKAIYSLPRWSKDKGKSIYITGASIHLVKEMARAVKHLMFGFHVLSQTKSEALVKAFSYDLQTNMSEERGFYIRLPKRYDKKKKIWDFVSGEEAYKSVASESVKRMRACILHCIPEEIHNYAISLASNPVPIDNKIGNGMTREKSPNQKQNERVRNFNRSLKAFQHLEPEILREDLLKKVNKEKEEDVMDEDFVTLRGLYNSVKDGLVDFFNDKKPEEPSVVKKEFKVTNKKETGEFYQQFKEEKQKGEKT